MTATESAQSAPIVQIDFGEGLTPEQRTLVEESIKAMAAQSAEATSRVRAAQARQKELAARLNRPLSRLIEEDPDAGRALTELQAEQVTGVDSVASLCTDESTADTVVDAGLALRSLTSAVEAPPYHYQWHWHHADGSPPFDLLLDRPTGSVGLDARGGVPGGATTFVEAHAGFGVALPSSPGCLFDGSSVRTMRHHFFVSSNGIGANATSEGGTECTVMDGTNRVAIESHRLWRGRVSGLGEFTNGSSPEVADSPMNIRWSTSRGHLYTFNVGVWVYCDYTSGAGRAAVQSLIQGHIPAMSQGRVVCTRPNFP